MVRIHLIYPDIGTGYYPNVHHGIASVVGALKARGHDVTLHHVITEESPADVAKRASETQPDIIGFSLCTNQIRRAEGYARALRKSGVDAFLIAGGIHPTSSPEETLKRLNLDAVSIGEVEITLPKLIEAIGDGRRDKLPDVEGFYFRASDGEMVRNVVPPLEPDLSKLPRPDYSLFDLKRIIKDSAGWMNMMLTRGCPYNCYYCCNSVMAAVYPSKRDYFRAPPVDHAMDIIRGNIGEAGGVNGIIFDDDLLCLNRKWFLSFAERYASEIRKPYTINARAESLSDDVIDALKESGCTIVSIGVESGNPWVRRHLLNRHYSNERLIEVFSKLHERGLLTSTFNMIGFPFETRRQMMDTLAINRRLRPYSGGVFYFYPYPNTRLHEICREYGLLNEQSEKLSGYFEAPSIRMTHASERDVKRICDRLRLYLYLGRVLINIRLGFMRETFYYLLLPFAGLLSRLLAGDSSLKRMIRTFVYRTMRSGDTECRA